MAKKFEAPSNTPLSTAMQGYESEHETCLVQVWVLITSCHYRVEVQYILDTAIDQLLVNKERKFIYVEIAFFMRWWREQTPEKQDQVGGLVCASCLDADQVLCDFRFGPEIKGF